MTMTAQSSSARAVIDIGTNSVKLLVAYFDGRDLWPMHEESVQTRLSRAGWRRHRVGRGYWKKSLAIAGVEVSVGTRVQLNGRNGLNARDTMTLEVVGLAHKITSGAVDVGAFVVAGDRLPMRLGRRVPSLSDAIEAVERFGMTDLPLIILALEHDGPGPALPKKRTRQGKAVT